MPERALLAPECLTLDSLFVSSRDVSLVLNYDMAKSIEGSYTLTFVGGRTQKEGAVDGTNRNSSAMICPGFVANVQHLQSNYLKL